MISEFKNCPKCNSADKTRLTEIKREEISEYVKGEMTYQIFGCQNCGWIFYEAKEFKPYQDNKICKGCGEWHFIPNKHEYCLPCGKKLPSH